MKDSKGKKNTKLKRTETGLLCSGLFKYYYYFNVISYVRKPRSHTCMQGQVTVDLSMRGECVLGSEELGRNGALVNRSILSILPGGNKQKGCANLWGSP